MINIYDSKKPKKSPTKHCSSKKFAYYEMFCKMFFFSSKIYVNVTFYIAKVFLHQLKILILPLTSAEIKPLSYKFKRFISFAKVLNISLDRWVWSFSEPYKMNYFNVDSESTEKTILVPLSRMIISILFQTTIKIWLRKFRLKEGVKVI